MANTIFFLMGPTASGKTPLAIKLVQTLPCDIISVDSAMVYRGLDIGSAKPDAETLKIAPHRLIDIADPSEAYSAGQFRTDALREIESILENGRIPLLVGGTMMYFRILQQGLANLPPANAALRQQLQERAEQTDWQTLHAELATIDPLAATRIHPHDSQRLQRALEVYLLTGKTITAWQQEATHPLSAYQVKPFAIAPQNRALLHRRIEQRFDQMLKTGFEEEVRTLHNRGDLSPHLPAIRSVGYRQMWQYIAGELPFETMREQAITATRQLAKRQLTWLRPWEGLTWFDSEADDLYEQVFAWLSRET